MSPGEQVFLVSMLLWTVGAQAALMRVRRPRPQDRLLPVDRHRKRA